MIEVKWCVVSKGISGLEGAQEEPIPMFSYLKSQNKKMNGGVLPEYMNCYALMEFCKNAFVITSPITINITFDWDKKHAFIDNFTQHFFDSFFKVREEFGVDRLGITLPPRLVFFSDESVTIETMPLLVLSNLSPLHNKLSFVTGKFNIGKWVRPIDISGELFNGVSEINIKRGDPLFIVRFQSGDKEVKLKRVYEDNKLVRAMAECADLKIFRQATPLNKCYELLDGFLRHLGFKNKIKKEKK